MGIRSYLYGVMYENSSRFFHRLPVIIAAAVIVVWGSCSVADAMNQIDLGPTITAPPHTSELLMLDRVTIGDAIILAKKGGGKKSSTRRDKDDEEVGPAVDQDGQYRKHTRTPQRLVPTGNQTSDRQTGGAKIGPEAIIGTIALFFLALIAYLEYHTRRR